MTPSTFEDPVAKIPDRVFFAFNSASLSADGIARLTQWVTYFKRYGDMTIRLDGQCDEQGTEAYNLAQDIRRVTAMRDYLGAQGIGLEHMTAISVGKDKPDPPGSSEAAWSKNRNFIAVATNLQ